MTTITLPDASPTLDIDAAALVRDIEQYLADQAPRTAHRLVTKTTAELVTEALASQPEQTTAPALTAPNRMWRILPDWALTLVRQLHAGTTRHITVAQHLELTALVIQQYGWAHGRLRTTSGGRCILGAQYVLRQLGYGDDNTAAEAGRHLTNILASRGIQEPIHRWNDGHGRTQTEVLSLIHEAASAARSHR
ncbi:hypothetical protein ACIQKB_04130 [Streptomyces sp. NPDC092046]|uniref:DUF6197 family protein n=1 Tax=Streptomyces sp. NPDC092046 TaxID=3366009 RepID=UPI0038185DB8